MHTIVVKEPGKPAEIRTVEKLDYETIKTLVEGWIELVRVPVPDGTTLDMYLNEEGKLMGLPHNFYFPPEVGTLPLDNAVGTVFLCSATEEGENVGLTDEQVQMAVEWFNNVDPDNVMAFTG